MSATLKDITNFIAFLEQKGAYHEFCEESNRQKNNSFTKTVNENKKNLDRIIDRAFTWENTISGSNYWASKSSEWEIVFEKGISLTEGCRSIW
jgi:hypothetical protein